MNAQSITQQSGNAYRTGTGLVQADSSVLVVEPLPSGSVGYPPPS